MPLRYLTLLCLFQSLAYAGEQQLKPRQVEFFENKIRPLLVEHCYKCHGDESKGGLRLDSRDGLLKGGDSGPAIIPGKPHESLLLEAVRYESLQMPPGGKLAAEQIADLEAWIRRGAPDPRTEAVGRTPIESLLDAGKNHWAFRPIQKPPMPEVDGAATEIDAFLLAKLHDNGWQFAPPADRRTLFRRAFLDLTGLPPTYEQVAEFVADESPRSFEMLVDRLLASPAYGERWGRHWLDVARYADSMGAIFNGVQAYPHAFTYRDYVIRSFNDDKPFDRFILEQLAADLVDSPADDNRVLAALGFVTVGRRPARTVDDDVYDDRIDVICRGLLGLTVGCARCHDHKLEPILTRDYYGLYGVLRSCTEPNVYPEIKPQPTDPEQVAWNAENERLRTTFTEAASNGAVEGLIALRGRVGDYLLAAHDGNCQITSKNKTVRPKILDARKLNQAPYNKLVENWPALIEKNPRLFAPWLAFTRLTDATFPEQAPALAESFALNSDGNLHPHVAALFAGQSPATLADVAELYNKLFSNITPAWRKQAAEELSQATHLQAGEGKSSSQELQLAAMGRALEVEQRVFLPDPHAEELRQFLVSEMSFVVFPPKDLGKYRLIPIDLANRLIRQQREVDALEGKPGAPWRAMALVESAPYDAKVFIRGDAKKPGTAAPRQFLEVLAGRDQLPFPKDRSGRLELARAIASSDNPLTARVIVNRVWAWHFGDGLVPTTSDFGFRGEFPSHPELLDYLASRFIAEGWSLKKLHRSIMASSAYQQASRDRPEMRAVDPENRLLWKFNARPLELEPLRDSLLAVSGRLDATHSGKAVEIGDPETRRRTVYCAIDRKAVPAVFRSFNLPDPNFTAGERAEVVQTPQALYLLNNPVVVACAKSLAKRVEPLRAAGSEADVAAIRMLYRCALQRDPWAEEIQLAVKFLRGYPQHVVVFPEALTWTYGFAEWNRESGSVTGFTPVSSFSGASIKESQAIGDKELADLEITATGGTAGISRALVRRWKAPESGVVNITAELTHRSEQGDGVVCRIVSSRLGVLGEWQAHNSSVPTTVEGVAVQAGDSLDFITLGRESAEQDAFTWSPTIVMPGRDLPAMEGVPLRWNARDDFRDVTRLPTPLGPWEELAQVILLSNEFFELR